MKFISTVLIFIYLEGRVTQREREKDFFFHPLVHSLNDFNSHGWARLKPRSRDYISHVCFRDKELKSLSSASQVYPNRKLNGKQSWVLILEILIWGSKW